MENQRKREEVLKIMQLKRKRSYSKENVCGKIKENGKRYKTKTYNLKENGARGKKTRIQKI